MSLFKNRHIIIRILKKPFFPEIQHIILIITRDLCLWLIHMDTTSCLDNLPGRSLSFWVPPLPTSDQIPTVLHPGQLAVTSSSTFAPNSPIWKLAFICGLPLPLPSTYNQSPRPRFLLNIIACNFSLLFSSCPHHSLGPGDIMSVLVKLAPGFSSFLKPYFLRLILHGTSILIFWR